MIKYSNKKNKQQKTDKEKIDEMFRKIERLDKMQLWASCIAFTIIIIAAVYLVIWYQ